MKVLISLAQMRPGNSGGIAPYAKNLAYHLASDFEDVDIHLAETFFNHKYFCEMPDGKCTRHLLREPFRYRDEIIELIKNIKPDVVFYPVAGGDPLFEFGSVKFVVCIADLQHKTYPGFFSSYEIYCRNKAFLEAVNLSHHLVTLSQHARSEICSTYNLTDDKVSVVSPALDKSYLHEQKLIPKADLIRRYNIPEVYLFYPANFWLHKNHANLFRALKILNDNGFKLNLVMTGDLFDKRKDLPALIKELDIESNVFTLGYLKINEVNSLVKYAKMIVFPSLFEGFGIPVLEAYANHIPLCCSNVTSLPEVAGDGALLFDPENPAEIAAAIKKLYFDADLCEKLVVEGDKMLKTFSYKHSARNLYKVFESLVNTESNKPAADLLTHNPLVTIVTPSYNQAEFIEKTIRSVLSQTYENIEYIVMDGGSTDGTVEILNKYSDRIKWFSESDDGQTDAINKGLRLSSGDYCCYLNSDDTLELDAIKDMLVFLESHQEHSMVYGDADYIDREDSVISPYETFEWDFTKFKGHCFICQPATMWRKETIEKYGYFDDTLNYIMDYEYWLRIAENGGSIGYLPKKLANSRLYGETKTLSGRGKIFREVFDISNKMFGETAFIWHKEYARYLIYERYNYLGLKHGSKLAKILVGLILLFRKPSGIYQLVIRRLGSLKFILRTKLTGLAKRFNILKTSDAKQSVTGMYTNGWVSNSMMIDYGKSKALIEAVIEGESPSEQTLTIDIDGDIVEKELSVGDFSLQLPVQALYVKYVSIRSDIDIEGGHDMAFFLSYTNLFSDLDVAWKS